MSAALYRATATQEKRTTGGFVRFAQLEKGWKNGFVRFRPVYGTSSKFRVQGSKPFGCQPLSLEQDAFAGFIEHARTQQKAVNWPLQAGVAQARFRVKFLWNTELRKLVNKAGGRNW